MTKNMSKQPIRRPVRPAVRKVVKKAPVDAVAASSAESSNEIEELKSSHTTTQEEKVVPQTIESKKIEPSPVAPKQEAKPKRSVETPSVPSKEEKKGKNMLPLILVLLILLGVCGYLGWSLQGTKGELAAIQGEVAQIEEAKVNALNSAQAEMDVMEAKLTELANQSADMKVNNEDLLSQIEDLKAQKAYYARKAAQGGSGVSLAELNDLRAKLDKQSQELLVKEEKILHLQKVNSKLSGQMHQLIEKQGKMVSELNTFQEKVNAASILFLETVQPSIINWKGEVVTDEAAQFKNKKIDKIRIVGTISDNKISPHGAKEFWIQISDPEGNTFLDSGSGGGTQTDASGETIRVTSTKNIMFDNAGEKIIFDYAQPKEYKNGTYKVSIYQEGNKVGTTEFDLY